MKQNTQEKKLFNFGISTLALAIFPLFWFLSQAILFRELTEIVTRNEEDERICKVVIEAGEAK